MQAYGYYPNFSGQVGVGKLDGDTEYQLNVRQVVYDWGRVSSKVDNSRAQSSLTSQKLKLARSTAAFETADTYLSYTQNRATVAIYEDYLRVLRQLVDVAEQRTEG